MREDSVMMGWQRSEWQMYSEVHELQLMEGKGERGAC